MMSPKTPETTPDMCIWQQGYSFASDVLGEGTAQVKGPQLGTSVTHRKRTPNTTVWHLCRTYQSLPEKSEASAMAFLMSPKRNIRNPENESDTLT